MTTRVLGEFEHQILLAVLRRGSESYSVEVVLELEERTGREVSAASVLVALGRLRDKGYLTDRKRRPGEEGGHARRYFSLTHQALQEMRASRQRYLNLWDGVEALLGEESGAAGERGRA